MSTRVRPFEVCQLFILLRAGDVLRDQNHGRAAITFYDHATKIIESHTSNQAKSLEAPQRFVAASYGEEGKVLQNVYFLLK